MGVPSQRDVTTADIDRTMIGPCSLHLNSGISYYAEPKPCIAPVLRYTGPVAHYTGPQASAPYQDIVETGKQHS